MKAADISLASNDDESTRFSVKWQLIGNFFSQVQFHYPISRREVLQSVQAAAVTQRFKVDLPEWITNHGLSPVMTSRLIHSSSVKIPGAFFRNSFAGYVR